MHAKAWKKTFDDFLRHRVKGGEFTPFDISKDYLNYVDGKPREEGIKSFLSSRDIKLPQRTSSDSSEMDSVDALGNLKNNYFLEFLSGGITAFKIK